MKRTCSLFLLLAIVASTSSAESVRRAPFWKSRRFWIPFALTMAAASADFATSQQAFARGQHETDPLFFSQRPSFGRMLAMDLPYEFGVSYFAYRRPGKLSTVILGEDLAEHSYLSVRNLRAPAFEAPAIAIAPPSIDSPAIAPDPLSAIAPPSSGITPTAPVKVR